MAHLQHQLVAEIRTKPAAEISYCLEAEEIEVLGFALGGEGAGWEEG